MWLMKDTKKPISLKKLTQSGFDPTTVEPESLFIACPITNGIANKQIEWLLELETLANETDPYIIDISLKKLLEKAS